MKLAFTCTLDDYDAAMRLFRKPAPGHGPGWAERLLFLWVLLGAVGLLLAVAVVEAILRGGPGRGDGVTTWAVAILTPWMPSLLILTGLWFLACGAIPATERRELRRLMLALAAVLLLVNAVGVLITGPAPRQPSPQPADQPPRGDGSLIALLPWLVMFLFAWVAFFRFLRGATRRNWDAQPHLRNPQSLELTPHGLRFEDGVCVRDYRWAGFTKWREGETLFLLYVSDVGFHMVPKRAMAGPHEVDQFRHLLWQHVRPIDPLPFGFPVQPAAPAVPRGHHQPQPPPLPTH